MYLPKSTYRFQVNSSFKLSDVKRLIPYLHKLGISTIYSAPFFSSTKGSNHGYDGTDPDMINPEIGTLDEFKEIHLILKENHMDWLQDIVPNHMAFSAENSWLMDIFEKGWHSEFYGFFDIDWDHPDPQLKGKVLAPFLGGEPDELIKKEELKLAYHEGAFFVDYFGMQYPLCWKSYYDIFSGMELSRKLLEEDYNKLVQEFKLIKENFDQEFSISNAIHQKEAFHYLYQENNSLKENVDQRLRNIQQDPNLFKSILDQQYFKLAFYMEADTKINFRRFFVVSQLMCLKMEDEQVFKRYHQFIRSLLELNLVQGLRIDHIDGLAHPKEYLERLRTMSGKDTYIIVEKILESEEKMPDSWPIQGTSGYEFLAVANHLFTKPESKERFLSIYKDFTGLAPDYEALVREKKSYMLKLRMGGELENLMSLFLKSGVDVGKINDHKRIKEAIFHLLVSFSVYRTYVDGPEYIDCDNKILDLAISKAIELSPDFREELNLIKSVIKAEGPDKEANVKFYMRLQQFTGPLAAKGVEDTTFYIYNRLISHNEVGDSPKGFGIFTENFHKRMQERLEFTPYSINTTSTHDTKRGEDARARINVLSEIPDEWQEAVSKWQEINKRHKAKGEIEMPDANDEYFIYQSVLGSFPTNGKVDEDFQTRTKDFMQKALREAKVHTDFPDYNEPYETATANFIDDILKDGSFLKEFLPFFNKVSDYGILQSLGLTLLKNTAPGIPDTYQG
ncbi:MAG: malto-oligosyltrehalose synthase, partial [Opitutaceae bacterium]|nr:malto-oligosyltrehalose synthase [Cytophagales bacterium]